MIRAGVEEKYMFEPGSCFPGGLLKNLHPQCGRGNYDVALKYLYLAHEHAKHTKLRADCPQAVCLLIPTTPPRGDLYIF